MHRTFLVTLAFITTLTALYAERRSIAVLPFIARGAEDVAASVMEDEFRVRLVERNVYIVLDRAHMERAFQEHELSLSETCDNTQCAIDVGQMLNMQYMVTGKLTKLGSKYYFTATIIDVETTTIENTTQEKFESLDDITAVVHNVLVKFFGGERKPYGRIFKTKVEYTSRIDTFTIPAAPTIPDAGDRALPRMKRDLAEAEQAFTAGKNDDALVFSDALLAELNAAPYAKGDAFYTIRTNTLALFIKASNIEHALYTAFIEAFKVIVGEFEAAIERGDTGAVERAEYAIGEFLATNEKYRDDRYVQERLAMFNSGGNLRAKDYIAIKKTYDEVSAIVENEGDAAFRAKRYADALSHYNRARAAIDASQYKSARILNTTMSP